MASGATGCVAAVVLNYGGIEDTVRCVEALKASIGITPRIFVVDNSSPGGEGQQLSVRFRDDDSVTVILSPTNSGYAAGNNLGLRMALRQGAHELLVVNPDITLDPYALSVMVAALEADPELAVVGPRILSASGEIQHYARNPLSFRNYLSIRRPFSRFMRKTRQTYLNLDYVFDRDHKFRGMVSGSCFLIRGSDYQDIGGLNEETFLYYEEDMLGKELDSKNRYVQICVAALATHAQGSSTQRNGSAFVDYHRYRSARTVLARSGAASRFELAFLVLFNLGVFGARAARSESHRRYFVKMLRDVVGHRE